MEDKAGGTVNVEIGGGLHTRLVLMGDFILPTPHPPRYKERNGDRFREWYGKWNGVAETKTFGSPVNTRESVDEWES